MANRTREHLDDVVLDRTLEGREKEFTLRKPLRVQVEKIDDEFIAYNTDLNCRGSGETQDEALRGMREMFEGVWILLIDNPLKEPNFAARRMKARLLEFAEEKTG